MKRATIALIGRTFNRLTVLGVAHPLLPTRSKLICGCVCGRVTFVTPYALTTGKTKSCGCLDREKKAARRYKHGRARSPLYKAWSEMRRRCSNPHSHAYKDYGARGIYVCDRWQSFENFLADMGERPPGMSLDRIDNDGPYSPENCRWATSKQQGSNTRATIAVVVNGKKMSAGAYADLKGINRPMLYWVMARHSLGPEAAAEYVITHRRRYKTPR